MKKTKSALYPLIHGFLPLAVMITLLSLLIYAAVQFNFRSQANDPQVEIAQNIAGVLTSGQPIPQSSSSADIASTYSPFIIIYNEKGEVAYTNGTLDGKTPIPPKGVFDEAKKRGEHRLTWEPKKGVRNSTVIKYYKSTDSGFILVGRSLKEVESRIQKLGQLVLLGWLITLAATFAMKVAYTLFTRSK